MIANDRKWEEEPLSQSVTQEKDKGPQQPIQAYYNVAEHNDGC